jgi:hypothetical protein
MVTAMFTPWDHTHGGNIKAHLLGGHATWAAAVAAMDAPRRQQIESMMRFAVDFDEWKGTGRGVSALNGLEMLQMVDAQLYLSATANQKLCLRCADPLFTGKTAACGACGDLLFCSAACEQKAWWHKKTDECTGAAAKRDAAGGLPQAWGALLAKAAPVHRFQVRYLASQCLDVDDADDEDVETQRMHGVNYDVMAHALWCVVGAHPAAADRPRLAGHALRTLGSLPEARRAQILQRIDALNTAGAGGHTIAAVGLKMFTAACDHMVKHGKVVDPAAPEFDEAASYWCLLPQHTVMAFLPLVPSAAIGGGPNPHGRGPLVRVGTSFINLSQALAVNHGLPKDYIVRCAPASVAPLFMKANVVDVLTGKAVDWSKVGDKVAKDYRW